MESANIVDQRLKSRSKSKYNGIKTSGGDDLVRNQIFLRRASLPEDMNTKVDPLLPREIPEEEIVDDLSGSDPSDIDSTEQE